MPDPGARTRRLFFAVWPDAATRSELRRVTRRAVRVSGGRPVPPDNYHITLAFLGNQPEARFEDIVRAGSRIAAQPIELTLDRFGFWPKPRVFWIGPTEFPPQLSTLACDLWDQLEPLDIKRERRPLRPHVTLARKVAAQPEVREPSPLKWFVSEFALIESVTDQRGAVYTVAKQYPLGKF